MVALILLVFLLFFEMFFSVLSFLQVALEVFISRYGHSLFFYRDLSALPFAGSSVCFAFSDDIFLVFLGGSSWFLFLFCLFSIGGPLLFGVL